MILAPDEIEQLGGFLPKLIGFVGASRLLPEPTGPIAKFVAAHAGEIAIIEKLSDFLLPGAGGIEALLVAVLAYSHPMDRAEADEWMRRQDTQT